MSQYTYKPNKKLYDPNKLLLDKIDQFHFADYPIFGFPHIKKRLFFPRHVRPREPRSAKFIDWKIAEEHRYTAYNLCAGNKCDRISRKQE